MNRLTITERRAYLDGSWLGWDSAHGPRCALCGCLEDNHLTDGSCGVCGCPGYEDREPA